jgi:hypothetical protein
VEPAEGVVGVAFVSADADGVFVLGVLVVESLGGGVSLF